MKVITFSRNFPATHPRKAQPTYFVEKIVRGLHQQGIKPFDVNCDFSEEIYYIAEPKNHTIRAGNRWKEGEWFSPRVWSGKPYCSKQIQFAPPIQIKKIWTFEMNLISRPFFKINGEGLHNEVVYNLAKNDGLTYDDFKLWFTSGKPHISAPFFKGQILCWNDSIDYMNYINS